MAVTVEVMLSEDGSEEQLGHEPLSMRRVTITLDDAAIRAIADALALLSGGD